MSCCPIGTIGTTGTTGTLRQSAGSFFIGKIAVGRKFIARRTVEEREKWQCAIRHVRRVHLPLVPCGRS